MSVADARHSLLLQMAANVERLREQAERIKALRRDKERRDGRSISQETAAHEIGVSSRTYRTWEGSGATLQFDNLKALADYYGTTTGFIEHGQDREAPDLSLNGNGSQLDRIEAKLDQILKRLPATLPAPQIDPYPPELEALVQTLLQGWRDLQAQQDRDEAEPAVDRRRASRSAAA